MKKKKNYYSETIYNMKESQVHKQQNYKKCEEKFWESAGNVPKGAFIFLRSKSRLVNYSLGMGKEHFNIWLCDSEGEWKECHAILWGKVMYLLE